DNCLLAAATAVVIAIDKITADTRNLTMDEDEARAAKDDGFIAKALIHPSHIEITNQVFTPSAEEVKWAEQVINAFDNSPDIGVVNIDGQMIDKPHEDRAKYHRPS